jgi:tetratricopeptide (TPR) repeat protein
MNASKCLAILPCTVLVASCSTFGPESAAPVRIDPTLEARLDRAAARDEAGKNVREGFRSLHAGDSAAAARSFKRALKLSPDDPQLHLLASIAYHLGYLRGAHANRDLAETGYLVALRLEPNNALASMMLGRLYLETGRFSDAQRWIGNSLLLGQSSAEAYYAFAVASYYARDLALAHWAIGEAERLQGSSAPVLRAGALVRAAAGEPEAAEERRRRYEAIEPDPSLRRSLAERISQWSAALDDLKRGDDAARRAPSLFAQAPAAQPTAPATPASGPISPSWSDCPQAAVPPPPSYGGVPQTASGDETLPLPALPSPCADRPLPRMALIDATIISSEDTKRTSKGINLLDSLSITLSGSLIKYNRVRGGETGNVNTRTRELTAGLGESASGITYSLNIANALDLRNEVLARPSLLALDRQPSTFFSGATLTTAVSGQFGGNAVDHTVGVSLSVTPTFIDDESMLLSVKAARSLLADASAGGTPPKLQDTVQSSRNAVVANVRIRFGETLALSGLNERENQENESGVPILKDIPLLQYLFKAEDKLDYTKSILILITPRRPSASSQPPAAAQGKPEEVEELRARATKTFEPTPNLDVVMANLDSSVLYRQFRSGDLRAQEWHRPEGFQRLMSEIADFLYY